MSENNGTSYVANPNLAELSQDFLYHINLGTKSHNLKEMFSGVKFVCVGGSPSRMEKLAKFLYNELTEFMPKDTEFVNLTRSTDRYVMYKVGPVLTASHGIGVPSMSILLNEIFKLLHHAGATDVTFFRIGTSGGLGLEPGSVVVTTQPLNGEMKPVFEQYILGKRVERPCNLDAELVKALTACAEPGDDFKITPGKTMCAHDFYEGQGRLDGAICDYTESDKLFFLKQLHQVGVRNIEMECIGFGALTHLLKIKGAVVCVTLLDRLIDDQIRAEHDTLKEYESRPGKVVARYIRRRLNELNQN